MGVGGAFLLAFTLVLLTNDPLGTRRGRRTTALGGIIGALGRQVALTKCTRLKCACSSTTGGVGAFSVGQVVFVTRKGVASH